MALPPRRVVALPRTPRMVLVWGAPRLMLVWAARSYKTGGEEAGRGRRGPGAGARGRGASAGARTPLGAVVRKHVVSLGRGPVVAGWLFF